MSIVRWCWWHNKHMAKRARGSNQYRLRSSVSVDDGPDLLEMINAPELRRCGEVWDSACPAWVHAPDWSHGRHGMYAAPLAVASHPRCPPHMLRQMANSGDEATQIAVAANPACPVDLLHRLASSAASNVRASVAVNRNCPTDVIIVLSQDPNRLVRIAIASRDDLEESVQSSLSMDKDWRVRRQLASNATPSLCQLRLAYDPDWHTRKTLAKNPHTDKAVLQALISDISQNVSLAALANPNCPIRELETEAAAGNHRQAITALNNPSYPATALKRVASHRYSDVRQAVAKKADCPLDVLIMLARDEHPQVRQAAMEMLPEEYRHLVQVAQ